MYSGSSALRAKPTMHPLASTVQLIWRLSGVKHPDRDCFAAMYQSLTCGSAVDARQPTSQATVCLPAFTDSVNLISRASTVGSTRQLNQQPGVVSEMLMGISETYLFS
jgi:hypothetical protein